MTLTSPFREDAEDVAAVATAAYLEDEEDFEDAEDLDVGELDFENGAPPSVTFPSGAALEVVHGPEASGEEHHEPHGTGNPLLDTSEAVRSTPLSESFTVGEVARSGAETFDRARIDPELVRCLQRLRDHVGKPVYVTSGYRPYRYNATIYRRRRQRPTRSRHSSGQAADVRIAGMTGVEIAKAAIDACGTKIGLGIGPDYAHIDVRGRFAVWTHLPAGPAADAALQDIIAYKRSRPAVDTEAPALMEWLPPPVRAVPAPGSAGPGEWVVLVAGFDYKRDGVDFEQIALNRMRVLIRRHDAARRKAKTPSSRAIAASPRVVLFDFKSGLVRRSVAAKPKGTRTWTEVARFKPITSANYSGGGHVFDTDQAGTLSITDVYTHVQEIGRTEPGSLGELSFFSHGWMGGPILVDSNDMSGSPGQRDPNDRDARIFKDFDAPTMDAAALAALGAAFARAGHAWVWGCAFANGPRQVMHRLLSSAKYGKTALGGLVDADVFRLAFERDQAEKFFGSDPDFFPVRGADGQLPLAFDRTFEQIKTYFSKQLGTYCQRFAVAAQANCFGALPGTYADYELGASLPIMVVPTKKPPYADDFTRSIHFYTTYLGVALDPEGRGYARYEP
jgi:hypothetical protein